MSVVKAGFEWTGTAVENPMKSLPYGGASPQRRLPWQRWWAPGASAIPSALCVRLQSAVAGGEAYITLPEVFVFIS